MICSQYSNSYAVSKATFVYSCSDTTRKVHFVTEVSNHKVVGLKKVTSRVVRQETTPLGCDHLRPDEQGSLPLPAGSLPRTQQVRVAMFFSFSKAMLHSALSPPNLSTSKVPAAKPNFIYAVSWKSQARHWPWPFHLQATKTQKYGTSFFLLSPKLSLNLFSRMFVGFICLLFWLQSSP